MKVPNAREALLIVDVQNDFCKGGALEVPDSEAIIPVVNQQIDRASKEGLPIIASRDWHPVDHCSFEHRDGPWPEHCVQDTKGSAFHPGMKLPEDAIRVSKGARFDKDAYSAFDDTDLASFLNRHRIKKLYVVGLALDVCVQATVKDACREGFEVELIADGTRAVESDKTESVYDELRNAGASIR